MNDLFTVYHAAKLMDADLDSVEPFILGAVVEDDVTFWKKVFPQGLKQVSDLGAGACYEKVVFAHSGSR